jgi:iron(III) transport system substrate-binding protein
MRILKTCIATTLLIVAALAIIIPVPVGNTDHLLTAAEAQSTSLTIYSGRSEELVGPIIEQFETDTGIEVDVIYGGTTALALQILEEGGNTPADVFYAQDAGALGLLAANDVLEPLPGYILDSVEPRFRSSDDLWVGITGRARVVTYNTDLISPDDLPATIYDFANPEWDARLGWAPTNASLHAHLSAIRAVDGEQAMRDLVEGLINNHAQEFESNGLAVDAVNSGEIEAALVNHYYMFRVLAENPDAPLASYHFPSEDIGNLVNVSGAGILVNSDAKPLAQQFVAFMLSRSAQTYFVEETYEYPMLIGVEADERLLPLSEIHSPDLDLSIMADLQGTLELLDAIRSE